MKVSHTLDLYTDYLIVQNSHATATGCSDLIDNKVAHDTFTRALSIDDYDSEFLWKNIKTDVRLAQNSNGVLILDNSIIAKPYSEVNELINYHYDHAVGDIVKGINLLTALVQYDEMSFPVGFETGIKDQICIKENKNGKEIMGRKSRYTLNQLACSLVKQALLNGIKFTHILGDIWFASKDNLRFFHKHKLKFVLGISSNRLVATSLSDVKSGQYQQLKDLELNDGESRKVYLKDILFPVVVTRKVFKNGDESKGELYLVTNDLTLEGDHIYDFYQRRWNVEVYHRSIKQNSSAGKSPTKVKQTQLNHVCLSLIAFSKLEKLKLKSDKNHYALKRQLLIAANQASYRELLSMRKKLKMTA